jgi:Spy/CpxP family protein refolding chaperone
MKNKLKFWIVFAAILVFGAGLVAGIFIDKCILPRRPGREGRRVSDLTSMDYMTRELGLTAQQQEQMKEIFKGNDERLKELKTQIHGQLSEVRTQLKDEIEKILTPEQKQKLEAMIQKHIAEQKRDSEERSKGEKK